MSYLAVSAWANAGIAPNPQVSQTTDMESTHNIVDLTEQPPAPLCGAGGASACAGGMEGAGAVRRGRHAPCPLAEQGAVTEADDYDVEDLSSEVVHKVEAVPANENDQPKY